MKTKIILIVFLVAVFVMFAGTSCLKKETERLVKEEAKTEKEQAIKAAKKLFEQKKAEGIDMSNGPCLSNEIIPGWVADVAHSPRQPIDDKPENQCPAYREGRAKHFVELDLDGNLIKAY